MPERRWRRIGRGRVLFAIDVDGYELPVTVRGAGHLQPPPLPVPRAGRRRRTRPRTRPAAEVTLSYTVTDRDRPHAHPGRGGQTIKVKVTFDDDESNTETLTNAASAILLSACPHRRTSPAERIRVFPAPSSVS